MTRPRELPPGTEACETRLWKPLKFNFITNSTLTLEKVLKLSSLTSISVKTIFYRHETRFKGPTSTLETSFHAIVGRHTDRIIFKIPPLCVTSDKIEEKKSKTTFWHLKISQMAKNMWWRASPVRPSVGSPLPRGEACSQRQMVLTPRQTLSRGSIPGSRNEKFNFSRRDITCHLAHHT